MMRLKHPSNKFSFVFWSGVLFLQQLHLWLLRGLDRKISGDSKVILLLPVIVEIYDTYSLIWASWYIYLSPWSIVFQIFSSNLSFRATLVVGVKSSLQVILTSKTLMKWMWGDIFCATKPCLEFWCQGDEDAIYCLEGRIFVGKATSVSSYIWIVCKVRKLWLASILQRLSTNGSTS